MLFAKLDLEILDDPVFLELADIDSGHPWRFLRLVQIAKRNGSAGGVVQRADGGPITARQLARLHDPLNANGEKLWSEFLATCVQVGLLHSDGNSYAVTHWRRWHSFPSDEKEETRERQRQTRLRRELKHTKNDDVTSCHELSRNVTSCHEMSRDAENAISTCHECHETEQSRAEHNRAEQSITEQSSQSTRARAHEGPTDVFLALGQKICEEFEPGSTFSRRRQQNVADIVANIGSSSFGGEQVREDDIRNAMLMAAALTRKRRQSDGVTNPWAYWVTAAKQKIFECVEFRFTHELQQKAIQNARVTAT